jgi:aminoglycoside phosphotransferase (APT) family kinase protein
VLLHGDYWPGNVLWHDGKIVAVIDWEDARLGDPLIDLAMSRLDLVWICGIYAMHMFTEQYQPSLWD